MPAAANCRRPRVWPKGSAAKLMLFPASRLSAANIWLTPNRIFRKAARSSALSLTRSAAKNSVKSLKKMSARAWQSFWITKLFRRRLFRPPFSAAAASSAAILRLKTPMIWLCCCVPAHCPLRWKFWKKEPSARVWAPIQSATALPLRLSG